MQIKVFRGRDKMNNALKLVSSRLNGGELRSSASFIYVHEMSLGNMNRTITTPAGYELKVQTLHILYPAHFLYNRHWNTVVFYPIGCR